MKKEIAELMKEHLLSQKSSNDHYHPYADLSEEVSTAFDELIKYVEGQIDDGWIVNTGEKPDCEPVDVKWNDESITLNEPTGSFVWDLDDGEPISHWRPSR